MVIQASGNNIRNILAMVRRAKGWKLSESREVCRSGGEDNLYRITLSNGVVIECTVILHSECSILIQEVT